MLGAAICAVVFRVNLPLALLTTLYTNPFTIVPLYIVAFAIGQWVLPGPGQRFVPPPEWGDESILAWARALADWMIGLGTPLALGLVLLASGLALAGYALVRVAWRIYLIRASGTSGTGAIFQPRAATRIARPTQHPVPQVQHPACPRRQIRVMGHQHQRRPVLAHNSSSRPKTASAAPRSRLPVGSSASTQAGCVTRARATATRWRSPPDSSPGVCAGDGRGRPPPARRRLRLRLGARQCAGSAAAWRRSPAR
jgi:hypothetical protein